MNRLLRNRRAQVIAGVVVAVLLAAAAIALIGGDDSSEPRASSTTRASSGSPGGFIAPLTGLRDPTSAAAHRPALTVKVGNNPAARPQSGLEQADVVYEEVVEGSITRLLAIFQSRVPAVVGPIRSVRRTDQGVVAPIGGVFVYSGGAAGAVASIRTAPVTLVDETRAGAAMFRDRTRSSPENLFGNGAALFALGAPEPPPPLFAYRTANARVPGVAVSQLRVGFAGDYAVSYVWAPVQKRWNRSIFGQPDLAASGVQEAPSNVVVMLVNYAGGAGVEGSEAQLVGEGDAVVFTGGHRITARWERPERARPARLLDASGAEVRLTPGQTWVELAPVGTAVTAS